MNLNKDTMVTLVILLVVTVFFHFRQYQTNKQVDDIAAKVIAMQENVEKIAYVTSTEIKSLKTEVKALRQTIILKGLSPR